jgi:hypothetical protein
MAQELKKVEPGDLVASDLMNLIIDELLDLQAKVTGIGGSGTVTMPSLFGMTLTSAKDLIAQPQHKLNLGSVLDAYGALLNPSAADVQQRLVINQYPVPGARVATGVFVNLLVGAKPAAGGGGPTPANTVKIFGFNPTKAHIGEPVKIIGENFFMSDLSKNEVTIGGVKTNTPTSLSQSELNVLVPEGISGAPVGAEEKPFSVKVKNPNGEASLDLILLAKRSNVPDVFNIMKQGASTPSTSFKVDSIVKVNGENFAEERTANQVFFGAVSAVPEQMENSTSALFVRVPLVGGLTPGTNSSVKVEVFVQSKGIKSKTTLTNITIFTTAT